MQGVNFEGMDIVESPQVHFSDTVFLLGTDCPIIRADTDLGVRSEAPLVYFGPKGIIEYEDALFQVFRKGHENVQIGCGDHFGGDDHAAREVPIIGQHIQIIFLVGKNAGRILVLFQIVGISVFQTGNDQYQNIYGSQHNGQSLAKAMVQKIIDQGPIEKRKGQKTEYPIDGKIEFGHPFVSFEQALGQKIDKGEEHSHYDEHNEDGTKNASQTFWQPIALDDEWK